MTGMSRLDCFTVGTTHKINVPRVGRLDLSRHLTEMLEGDDKGISVLVSFIYYAAISIC
jgi:hypothetical protein